MTVDVPMRFVRSLVALLVSAGVVTLAAGQLLGHQQIPPDVTTPVVTWLAPLVASLVLLALFGFRRAVDRVRREIKQEAGQQQSP